MSWEIHQGDAPERLREMPRESVQCCVTSPPYFGLRDYGAEGQLGLEKTPSEYVAAMVEVFAEVRRVLRSDGTLWLNIGDSYNAGRSGANVPGLKPKDLIGIPWMLAFALRAEGWCLRSDIIWAKPNPMPESVTDRPTKAHEYLFLLTKSARYYYNAESIREPLAANTLRECSVSRPVLKDPKIRSGKGADGSKMLTIDVTRGANKRSVWWVAAQPFPGAHFATFPPALVEPCILAGSRPGDTILDPFSGAATTGLVATQLGRDFIGIELNPEYVQLGEDRIRRWQNNPAGTLTGEPEPIEGQVSLLTEEAA